MKKLIKFLSFIFILTPLSTDAQTDWVPGKFMIQSVANTLSAAYKVTNATSYGYKDGICVLSAYIKENNYASMKFYLTAGVPYLFIGGGDTDAVDVDLVLSNSSGTEIASDRESDNKPYVIFTPIYSGDYSIKLRLYSSESEGSFCTLAVLQKGANFVPISNLSQAMGKLITMGAVINAQNGVKFHDKFNEWCLYGAVLSSEQSTSISNLNMGSESHYIIGAGDRNLSDGDLALYSGSSSTTTFKDENGDPTPIVSCYTSSSMKYKLKISNISSAGKSLFLSAVLND